MDMLMLDLGDPAGPGAAVRPGDEAVLFGEGGPSALHVAECAGTIAYAVTCGLTARVPRVYVGAALQPPEEPLLAEGAANRAPVSA
jgi:alanine racemase